MEIYEINYQQSNTNINHIFEIVNQKYKVSTYDEDSGLFLDEELPYPNENEKGYLYKAMKQEKKLVEDRVRSNTRTIIHCETYKSEGGLENARKSLIKNKNRLVFIKNKIEEMYGES